MLTAVLVPTLAGIEVAKAEEDERPTLATAELEKAMEDESLPLEGAALEKATEDESTPLEGAALENAELDAATAVLENAEPDDTPPTELGATDEMIVMTVDAAPPPHPESGTDEG